MAKLEVTRSLRVAAEVRDVRTRLFEFADRYRFRVSRDMTTVVEFAQGGLLGELFASDVLKVPTTLRVELEGEGDSTLVTITLVARARLGLFTAGDRASLDQRLDLLAGVLSGRSGGDARVR